MGTSTRSEPFIARANSMLFAEVTLRDTVIGMVVPDRFESLTFFCE